MLPPAAPPKIKKSASPKGRTGKAPAAPTQANDPQFEQLHPRAPKGRVGGGEFAKKGDGYGQDKNGQAKPSPVVNQLQERLQQLGFQVARDGKFGGYTEQAVKSFQQKYGLEATGKVDAATTEVMRNPPEQSLSQVQDQKARDSQTRSNATKAAQDRTGTGSGSGGGSGSGSGSTPQEGDANFNWRTDGNGKRGVTLKDGSKQVVNGEQYDKLKAEGKLGHNPALLGDSASDRAHRSGSTRSRVKRGTFGGESLHKGQGMGSSSNSSVKAAQEAIDALGYDLGPAGVDGRFGPDTEKAVKKLQRRYGLKADGIVGAQTKALLKRIGKRHAQAQAKGDQLTQITEADYAYTNQPGNNAVGWPLQPDMAIDDGRTVTPDPRVNAPILDSRDGPHPDILAKLSRLAEAVEETVAARSTATTGIEKTVLLARENVLRARVEETAFAAGLHPRGRGGKFVRSFSVLMERIKAENAAHKAKIDREERMGAAELHTHFGRPGHAVAAASGLSVRTIIRDPVEKGYKSRLTRGLASHMLTEALVEEALLSTLDDLDSRDWRVIREAAPLLLEEAADSLAKASTPEPFSTSKTSNWVARGGGLPAYIQHIAHALVEKGKSTSHAIAIAIATVKRWAAGVGKVDSNTRAAARKALSEWEALKAKAHAKKG